MDRRLKTLKKAHLLEKKANSRIQHLFRTLHFILVAGCPHEFSGEASRVQESAALG